MLEIFGGGGRSCRRAGGRKLFALCAEAAPMCVYQVTLPRDEEEGTLAAAHAPALWANFTRGLPPSLADARSVQAFATMLRQEPEARRYPAAAAVEAMAREVAAAPPAGQMDISWSAVDGGDDVLFPASLALRPVAGLQPGNRERKVMLVFSREPRGADLGWALLCACLRPGEAPVRPVTVHIAARCRRGLPALLALLARICTFVRLESWPEAAGKSLRHSTDPWGQNGGMACCVTCGVTRVQSKLRRCGACQMARYCSAESAKADWQEHRMMCAVLVDGRKTLAAGGSLQMHGYCVEDCTCDMSN